MAKKRQVIAILQNPKLSIITSCYNSERYLRECLDSIINQTFKDWELIIIDDGSKDNTPYIIRDYSERDTRIRPYYFSTNEGFYIRINFGIQHSNSEFIVIHGSDDIMCPTMLERLYSEITADERLGLVGSFYRMFLEEFTGWEYTQKREFPTSNSEIIKILRHWGCGFCDAFSIKRKRIYELIGLYDENPYGSDGFWLVKSAEYAYHSNEFEFKNIPEFLGLRRIHPHSLTQVIPSPSLDPRSKRAQYIVLCNNKLKELRENLSLNADLKTEIKKCRTGNFDKQIRNSSSEPEQKYLDPGFSNILINRAINQFKNGEFIDALMTFSALEKMFPIIFGFSLKFIL